jgi:hypothetical protein
MGKTSEQVRPDLPNVTGPLPGRRARAIIERDAKVVSPSYTRSYPLVAERGEGAMVEDVDGNRFLDFNAGIAVVATGHCHPRVVEAAREQGRLLVLKAGEPVTAAPSAVPTAAAATPEPTQAVTADPAATSTPLPTDLPQAASDLPVGIEMEASVSNTPVIDPRPFLNTALIPAAVVVTGAGLVTAGRIKRAKEENHPDQEEQTDEKH